MTDWIDFAKLREQVSLKQVLLEYYQISNLKQRGNKLIGPCPVHNGDSPRAFHADLDKNVWHCFTGCHSGGNQLDLVVRKENIGLREAALKLQAFFSPLAGNDNKETTVPADPMAPAKRTKQEKEADNTETEGNAALTVRLQLLPDHPHLIRERGLSFETINHFGLGYARQGIMRGCIAIPIHDEVGTLVAYAGRRLKPKDIREEGKYKFPRHFRKELVLYNYHLAKEHMKERGLILAEGFFAVIKLFEIGFPNAVACMGSALSDAQAEQLFEAKEVIILFDGDNSGTSGAETARDKLKDKVKVRLVRLPQDTAPDDFPPRALRWLINGVMSLNLSEISLSQYTDSETTSASASAEQKEDQDYSEEDSKGKDKENEGKKKSYQDKTGGSHG
jgi:DNA primase